MPNWIPFHGWMKFERLDANDGLGCSFTIGYRFTYDDAPDNWTVRFNGFKQKKSSAIHAGVNVMTIAVPLLVEKLGLDKSETVFIPALSSNETQASNKGALSFMTCHCAVATGVDFVQDAVIKKVHSPLHNTHNAARRREILDNADYKSREIKAKDILIFDDFITRGDTLSHIAQAIHAKNQGVNVYGVGLGKTERRAYHKDRFGVELSNDHVPEKWDILWKSGGK